MLQIYCIQQWHNLSDPAMEDALYETPLCRSVTGQRYPRSFYDSEVPHLLEQHDLTRQIFDEVNQWLSEAGILIDAIIIEAPSSTKNRSGEREAWMH